MARRCFPKASVLLLSLLASRVAVAAPSASPLSDYIGTYADEPGRTTELVAGDELFAVQRRASKQNHGKHHPAGFDSSSKALDGPSDFPDAVSQATPQKSPKCYAI